MRRATRVVVVVALLLGFPAVGTAPSAAAVPVAFDTTLRPAPPGPGTSSFGQRVAFDGDDLAAMNSARTLDVFHLGASGWVREQVLADAGTPALDADRLVHWESGGTLVVRQRGAGTWAEVDRIPNPIPSSQMGREVALTGDVIVTSAVVLANSTWVGAYGLVFERTPTGWVEAFRTPLTVAHDRAQNAVAFDGTTVAFGSSLEITLVRRGPQGWSVAARLPGGLDRHDLHFGKEVAVADGVVVTFDVSSPWVLAFEDRGNGWEQVARFRPSSSGAITESLAIDSGLVAVGQPVNSGRSSVVTLFSVGTSGATEEAVLPQETLLTSGFGDDVVLVGEALAIGVNEYGAGTGRVDLFRLHPPGATVPGPPTGLVVKSTGQGRAELTWTKPDNGGALITAYEIAVSPGSVINESSGETFAAISGLTNGTTYTFTVTARNGVGAGPPSDPVQLTPTVALSVDGVARPEGTSGTTSFSFVVRLAGPSTRVLSIPYQTKAGTATGGVDYDDVSGVLDVPAGATVASVAVPVQGDTALEPDETFTLEFSAGTGYVVPPPATGRIETDDVPPTTTGSPQVVNLDSAGQPMSLGDVRTATMSADGRVVAFEGPAALVASDTNGSSDVYLRNLDAGFPVLVSATPGGRAGNGRSRWPSISASGGVVAFESKASDLVPGDANGQSDVFVRDTKNAATALVSTGAAGPGNGDSGFAIITPDGTKVVFASGADNLVPGDTNGFADVFLRDLAAGTTTRVSVGKNGMEPDSFSFPEAVTPDGRYVVFRSPAENLAPGRGFDNFEFYRRDLVAGTTKLVSAGVTDTIDGLSVVEISDNGSVVAFDARVYDEGEVGAGTWLWTGAATAVDLLPDAEVHFVGLSADGGTVVMDNGARYRVATRAINQIQPGYRPEAVSPDGRFVALRQGFDQSDRLIADLLTGARLPIDVDPTGPSDAGRALAVSDDGSHVVVQSMTKAPTGASDRFDVAVGSIATALPGDVKVVEGDTGKRSATVTVSLARPHAAPVTVGYKVNPGTATAADIVLGAGQVTVPAGELTAVVEVPLRGDLADEPDEGFVVKLQPATTATTPRPAAAATVVDDDPSPGGPHIDVADVTIDEGDAQGDAVRRVRVSVNLSAPVGVEVRATATTVAATAQAGADFVPDSVEVVIPAGGQTGWVDVRIVGDRRPEPAEHLTVELSGIAGPVVGGRTTGRLTLLDRDR